jgi:hypothetical protein
MTRDDCLPGGGALSTAAGSNRLQIGNDGED